MTITEFRGEIKRQVEYVTEAYQREKHRKNDHFVIHLWGELCILQYIKILANRLEE